VKTRTKLNSETPKFYEMDGALRAYSNRSIVLAGIMGLVALIAVAGFLFVRMEPPTVIRVGANGQASVVSPIQRAKTESCRHSSPTSQVRWWPTTTRDKPSSRTSSTAI